MSGIDISATPDLGNVEDEGIEVHVADIDGEPMYYGENNDKPVTIRVAGTYSNRYRRVEEAQNTKRIKRRGRGLDGKTLADDRRSLVAACVIDWEGFFDSGAPMECDKNNIKRVFEALPYIQEQVERAMEDHEAFFRNGSKN